MEITIPQTISQDSATRADPSPEQGFDESALPGRRARVRPGWRDSGWLHGLIALAAVYLFIAAIEMMGGGLKTIATDPASKQHLDSIYAYTHNPFSALCIGILLTAIVQSSSFTTTFVVGLVAGGQISLADAIPVIMGANIGTSVTNLLVSLAHLRNRQEFRRSLAGAVVHDIFNVLTVLLVLPLELGFGILSRPAHAFADWLEGAAFFTTDPKKFNFVKMAIQPLGNAMKWLLHDALNLSATWAGITEAILAVLLLFVALYVLVKVLQGLLKERLAGLFSKTLFRNQGVSFFVGLFTTAAVQSSSVTTSLVVPLVGAGVQVIALLALSDK
ncbi:MAG TPA: Na/Pi symporter, partial [Phycisphaerae bacterium]|nr:Na/Pi symporter [Phycisphaerae bacterium]